MLTPSKPHLLGQTSRLNLHLSLLRRRLNNVRGSGYRGAGLDACKCNSNTWRMGLATAKMEMGEEKKACLEACLSRIRAVVRSLTIVDPGVCLGSVCTVLSCTTQYIHNHHRSLVVVPRGETPGFFPPLVYGSFLSTHIPSPHQPMSYLPAFPLLSRPALVSYHRRLGLGRPVNTFFTFSLLEMILLSLATYMHAHHHHEKVQRFTCLC